MRGLHTPGGGGAAGGEHTAPRYPLHGPSMQVASAPCACKHDLLLRHISGLHCHQVGRAVPGLGQLPRGTLEGPLRDLATTLDFGQPVASLQVCIPQDSPCTERIAGVRVPTGNQVRPSCGQACRHTVPTVFDF